MHCGSWHSSVRRLCRTSLRIRMRSSYSKSGVGGDPGGAEPTDTQDSGPSDQSDPDDDMFCSWGNRSFSEIAAEWWGARALGDCGAAVHQGRSTCGGYLCGSIVAGIVLAIHCCGGACAIQ
eukprot:5425957-Alexandrium_andersonii.AAC.1